MSRPLKAVAALGSKSPSEQVMLGIGIDQYLTAHKSVFTTPQPTQAEIVAVTTELQAAIEEAATGSQAGRQRLKKARKAFRELIGIYQGYVDQVAKGDGVIIEQSGLAVSKPGHKAGPMQAPANPRLSGDVVGQLTALVQPQTGAKSYVWMIYVGANPPVDDKDWLFCDGTTQARLILKQLTSGSRIWMRCCAIGTRGRGPWSESVSRLVL